MSLCITFRLLIFRQVQITCFMMGYVLGGEILKTAELNRVYATGSGSVTIRGKVEIEGDESSSKSKRNQRACIVITELPYLTNKARIDVDFFGFYFLGQLCGTRGRVGRKSDARRYDLSSFLRKWTERNFGHCR